MDVTQVAACLPLGRLHPFSRMVLDHYLNGALPTQEFLRWFHMPNSDYLPVARCIVDAVDPAYLLQIL